jgi:hypothetical protein
VELTLMKVAKLSQAFRLATLATVDAKKKAWLRRKILQLQRKLPKYPNLLLLKFPLRYLYPPPNRLLHLQKPSWAH